jgi:hypothetical protein
MYRPHAMTTLRKLNDAIPRPNQGGVTRWGAMIGIYMWVAKYWDTLLQDREPEDCVDNDDGKKSVHVYTRFLFVCSVFIHAMCLML